MSKKKKVSNFILRGKESIACSRQNAYFSFAPLMTPTSKTLKKKKKIPKNILKPDAPAGFDEARGKAGHTDSEVLVRNMSVAKKGNNRPRG
jgi:hypothetical protein